MIRTRSKVKDDSVLEKIVVAASLVSWLVNGVSEALSFNPGFVKELEDQTKKMLQCLDFEHVFVNLRFSDLNCKNLEAEVVVKDWDQDVKSFTEHFLLTP